MQPTFLPWIGYFALMERVDEFIILDDVQFERRSWQQRNRIRTRQGEQMLTVPVIKKGQRDQMIFDVQVLMEDGNSIKKICKGIENSYRKAPFYDLHSDQIYEVLQSSHGNLCDLNVELIKVISRILGIATPLFFSSDIKAEGAKDIKLANICKCRMAKSYVSPIGSKSYLDASSIFHDYGISIDYHDYRHPLYKQMHADFIPYMSVIDLIFNHGPKSREIMLSGL